MKKQEWKLLDISIWKLCAYFILYSFLGYIIETLFGILTTGVWESRQSFLYGPFCGIYGIGAVCIILFSQYFKENNLLLFSGGFLIGSVTEYIVSFLVEITMKTRWWDYSDRILNMNGRICLLYSIFWSILTVLLVKKINPKMDKLVNKFKEKIPIKTLKGIVLIVTIFLAIDCLATCYAQDQFMTRMIVEHDIEIDNKEAVIEKYKRTYENETLSRFIHKVWGDRKMIRTFPNIKIEDKNHDTIYIDSLLPEIQPYYRKIFEK